MARRQRLVLLAALRARSRRMKTRCQFRAENDEGAWHVRIFEQEVQRYRLVAEVGDRGFKALSSSGPASFTPPSVSGNQ
jgi:hypothetical protein